MRKNIYFFIFNCLLTKSRLPDILCLILSKCIQVIFQLFKCWSFNGWFQVVYNMLNEIIEIGYNAKTVVWNRWKDRSVVESIITLIKRNHRINSSTFFFFAIIIVRPNQASNFRAFRLGPTKLNTHYSENGYNISHTKCRSLYGFFFFSFFKIWIF